jgi:hypothetical protein
MEILGGLSRAEGRRQRKDLEKQIAADLRLRARAKLRELTQAIRDAKVRRKEAIADARRTCREGRLAVRERIKALRRRVLEELRALVRAERTGARERCTTAKREAKSHEPIERARRELVAERQYRRELAMIERGQREKKREMKRASRRERQSESDDEVRANISPDMVPLFEQVKHRIKAGPRASRTEVFLRYAEEHAGELVEAIEDVSEARLAELVAERERAERYARRRRYTAAELAEVPF